jgi:hypothetical protein
MRGLKIYASLGPVLLALSIAGANATAASAQGQTPGAQRANPHPIHLAGSLKAVGSNNITLSTRGGDVTANIGPDTWIVVKQADGPGEGSLSDLKVNEPVAVAGMTTNDPKVINARVVTQGVREGRMPPGGQRGPNRAQAGGGTIKSISGSTLTVTGNRGRDVLVETTADTVVLDNGFKAVSALKVGDKVQVLGLPQRVNRNARPTPDNLKVNAWAVRVVREGVNLVPGQVATVSGNTLTLDTRKQDGNLTINLSGATQYRMLTISATDRKATLGNASQADVQAGSRLVVEGTRSADGKTLNATSIIIVPDKVDTAPQF